MLFSVPKGSDVTLVSMFKFLASMILLAEPRH